MFPDVVLALVASGFRNKGTRYCTREGVLMPIYLDRLALSLIADALKIEAVAQLLVFLLWQVSEEGRRLFLCRRSRFSCFLSGLRQDLILKALRLFQ